MNFQSIVGCVLVSVVVCLLHACTMAKRKLWTSVNFWMNFVDFQMILQVKWACSRQQPDFLLCRPYNEIVPNIAERLIPYLCKLRKDILVCGVFRLLYYRQCVIGGRFPLRRQLSSVFRGRSWIVLRQVHLQPAHTHVSHRQRPCCHDNRPCQHHGCMQVGVLMHVRQKRKTRKPS